MKRLFYFTLLCAFAFVSCDDSKDYYVERGDDTSKFVMTEGYTVPVKDEHISIVRYNGEVLFEGNMSIEIQVPKKIISTRVSGVETEHKWIKGSGNGSGVNWFNAYKKGVLMFEDIKTGDNDYNDFICYIDEVFEYKINSSGSSNLKLEQLIMRPIAMGNTLPLEFGVEILIDGNMWKDLKLSGDVRKDFYSGKDGFINTAQGADYVEGKTITLKNENSANGTSNIKKSFSTNYYIVVKGVKHYACDSDKATLTDSGTPFGLFIPQVESFAYPQETFSIYEAYPNFEKWVDGKSNNPFANPQTEYIYTRN